MSLAFQNFQNWIEKSVSFATKIAAIHPISKSTISQQTEVLW